MLLRSPQLLQPFSGLAVLRERLHCATVELPRSVGVPSVFEKDGTRKQRESLYRYLTSLLLELFFDLQ